MGGYPVSRFEHGLLAILQTSSFWVLISRQRYSELLSTLPCSRERSVRTAAFNSGVTLVEMFGRFDLHSVVAYHVAAAPLLVMMMILITLLMVKALF